MKKHILRLIISFIGMVGAISGTITIGLLFYIDDIDTWKRYWFMPLIFLLCILLSKKVVEFSEQEGL